MKAVLCVALLVAAVSAISSTDPQVEQFRKFMHRYDKVYNTNEEFDKRFSNFKENLKIIDDLNAKEPLAVYGITIFSDLSKEEFRAKYLLPVPHSKPTPSVDMFLPVNTMAAIPTSIDWRTKGAVTAVKNQGDCGSCWAFSTTEEIESQWFLAGHKLIELSEQQIVDCDTTDAGCGGGDTPTAYQYVISAGGLELESQYPYTGEDGTCQANPKDFAAKILGWKYACKGNNETEMAANLVKYGPLSICVDASSWQNYQGGIITSNCGNSLDHCVQVVGYATSSGNVPYWLVRNSWGTDWGENGYLRVERDQNLCGISDEVTIALVDGPSTTGGSGPAATSSSTSSSSSSSSSSGAVPGFNGGLF